MKAGWTQVEPEPVKDRDPDGPGRYDGQHGA